MRGPGGLLQGGLEGERSPTPTGCHETEAATHELWQGGASALEVWRGRRAQGDSAPTWVLAPRSSSGLSPLEGLPQTASAWHASRYGSLDQGFVHRSEQARIRTLLEPYQGQLDAILDAPAGYGRLTSLLCELAPRLLISLDLNSDRLRCVPRLPGVCLLQGDLGRLPCEPRQFDLVACLRHLQHLRDSAERASRLLDLAGASRRLLLLSYYQGGTLHALQRRFMVLSGRRKRALGWCTSAEVHQVLGIQGFRVLSDRALLPGLHAQRLLLAERKS